MQAPSPASALLFSRALLTQAAHPTTSCLSDVRGVLRLSGPTLIHFLQGLVTNDVTPLEQPSAPPVYACILNAQGRYLHDMFLVRTPDAEPTVLVDTDAAGKDDLLRLLRRYRLRQALQIDDASDRYAVWVQYGPEDLAPSRSSWRDPRLRQLGLRAVKPAESQLPGPHAPWEEFRRWRVAHGVAEGDSEIPSGEAIALEYNVDGLSGISFSKGCYVGQELMARTHFKGVVRKRLMPFRAAAGGLQAARVGPGSPVYAGGAAPKEVGRVRVVAGEAGLAVLRLEAALAAAAGGPPLTAAGGGGEVHVQPWRPAWWPPEWGAEQAAGPAA